MIEATTDESIARLRSLICMLRAQVDEILIDLDELEENAALTAPRAALNHEERLG